MTAALVAVIGALVAVIAAGGTVVWLSLRLVTVGAALAKAQSDLEAERRDRATADARAARVTADLTEYRLRAGNELAALRADLVRMSDEAAAHDPADRRRAWGVLLARADGIAGTIAGTAGTSATVGTDPLPGVHAGQPAPAAAVGGTGGPGPGRAAT